MRLKQCLVTISMLGRIIVNGGQRIVGFGIMCVGDVKLLCYLLCMVVSRNVQFSTAQYAWGRTNPREVRRICPTFPFLSPMPRFNQRIGKVLIFRGTNFLRRQFVFNVRGILRRVILRRATGPWAKYRRTRRATNRYRNVGCNTCAK